MRKIVTLFERDPTTHEHLAIDKVREEFAWVADGFGIAMEKLDGENCMIKNRVVWKRMKLNDQKDFTDASYVLCHMSSAVDVPFMEAWGRLPEDDRRDGIYEAIGPGIKGNPYGLFYRELVPILPPRTDIIINEKELGLKRNFEGIKTFLTKWPIEGIVFKHPDGRMAKIKRTDFGLKWPDIARLKTAIGAVTTPPVQSDSRVI